MMTPDTTTEELPGGPRRPRVLFTVAGTVFEFVRKLEMRSTGELLMLAQRRYRNGLGGPVVVKRLRNPATFVERRRLVEEVDLTFRLNHPAIAKVLLLKLYRGAPHVVMEYVEGRSLDTVLNLAAMRRRPLSAEFAAHVTAEVAEALNHAHALTDEWSRPLNIVHRDVSPRNIRVGVHGEVKLTHFTVAASSLPGREVTSRELVKGDIAYASPEALRRRQVDARSDLFSLGLVLLELLTGRHPLMVDDVAPVLEPDPLDLQAQGPTWMPVKEVAARMAQVGPEQVERLAAGVPEPLRVIVQRALRQQPSERFQTGAEMAEALRAWLGTQEFHEGRRAIAREVEQAAVEATVRRNQAELLEGGLHPEGLTVEEAALAGEPSSETPLGEAAGSAVRLSQVAELTLEARITQTLEPAADARPAATAVEAGEPAADARAVATAADSGPATRPAATAAEAGLATRPAATAAETEPAATTAETEPAATAADPGHERHPAGPPSETGALPDASEARATPVVAEARPDAQPAAETAPSDDASPSTPASPESSGTAPEKP
ncbi:serine/threonine-protein kinase [Corallococcus macrosporus]|uniref:Serine/threonine protein kinase n=1 Tax=Corallococcus macrosporus DSM 14697 TaxID=1189310 RepID=A0A286NW84_9BACT|nr:serine/threonine-protein kinase [Corallococcus macrosporus]ATB51429.1 serine/threonine protein kinase [Corallococcus macrosporus DSM 14697]